MMLAAIATTQGERCLSILGNWIVKGDTNISIAYVRLDSGLGSEGRGQRVREGEQKVLRCRSQLLISNKRVLIKKR
jgi:hypothetical protein